MIANGKRFQAHRLILASQSEYFDNLLFNENFRESSEEEIEIKGANDLAFENCLRFIYTGILTLDWNEQEELMETFFFANFLGLGSLEKALYKKCAQETKFGNIASMLRLAALFNGKELKEKCWEVIESNRFDFIGSKIITLFDHTNIIELFSRPTFKVLAILKFQMLAEWFEKHQNCEESVKHQLLSLINLNLLSNSQIIRHVFPKMLYNSDFLVESMAKRGKIEEEKGDILLISFEIDIRPLQI